MKRYKKLVIFLLPVLLLSSCLDAIQHITLNKNGDIELTFILTMSKSLFEMGGASEGESLEDTFSEDVINPDELSSMIPQAEDVEVKLINSDIDYGYKFKFTIPRNFAEEEDTPMVPRINWDNIEILLAMPTSEDSTGTAEESPSNEMDEMGEAIFSSAKYKVQISKKILEYSSKAYIRTEDGEITDVDIIDLGDTYLVNLPMLMVMMNEQKTYLVFEF